MTERRQWNTYKGVIMATGTIRLSQRIIILLFFHIKRCSVYKETGRVAQRMMDTAIWMEKVNRIIGISLIKRREGRIYTENLGEHTTY